MAHLKGVKVIQAPWAGVNTLLKLFPPGVILCDARGVHDIPTAEWALTAILAMEKFLPLFIEMQRQGKWAAGQQIDGPSLAKSSPAQSTPAKLPPTKIKDPPAPIHDVADSTVLIVGYGSIGPNPGLHPSEQRLCAWRAVRARASFLLAS